MRTAIYAKLVRLSFGFYDRHQTGQLMCRATVDLQGVRFFLGYGLIFFFQHVFTVLGVGRRRLPHLLEARADLARDRAVPGRGRLPLQPRRRIRSCATCSRRWPTSRRSPRRTSSASTSSSRSRRRRPSRRSSSAAPRRCSRRASRRTASGRSTCRCSRSCRSSRRRRSCSSAGGWSPTARSRSATSSRFNLYLAMLVMPLRALGMWIGQAQRATASGERIFQVIDEPEEIGDAPGAGELPPGPGPRRLRGRHLRLRPRAAGAAATIDLELERGPGRRADRPHRLGQDDARLARPALLRRPGGPRARSTAPTCAT